MTSQITWLPLRGFSGIIKQIILNGTHNKYPQLVGGEPVSYFTSVAEDLNSRLPKTNPATDQDGT